jgi:hypothetical protein
MDDMAAPIERLIMPNTVRKAPGIVTVMPTEKATLAHPGMGHIIIPMTPPPSMTRPLTTTATPIGSSFALGAIYVFLTRQCVCVLDLCDHRRHGSACRAVARRLPVPERLPSPGGTDPHRPRGRIVVLSQT